MLLKILLNISAEKEIVRMRNQERKWSDRGDKKCAKENDYSRNGGGGGK
jgi:hypothetical protein